MNDKSSIESFKSKVLNKLLEWCVLDEKNITEKDQEFLNDLTLTAIDNILNYIDNPSPEKLEYLKYYIVSIVCASYNIGHGKVDEIKKKTNDHGEEWKTS